MEAWAQSGRSSSVNGIAPVFSYSLLLASSPLRTLLAMPYSHNSLPSTGPTFIFPVSLGHPNERSRELIRPGVHAASQASVGAACVLTLWLRHLSTPMLNALHVYSRVAVAPSSATGLESYTLHPVVSCAVRTRFSRYPVAASFIAAPAKTGPGPFRKSCLGLCAVTIVS